MYGIIWRSWNAEISVNWTLLTSIEQQVITTCHIHLLMQNVSLSLGIIQKALTYIYKGPRYQWVKCNGLNHLVVAVLNERIHFQGTQSSGFNILDNKDRDWCYSPEAVSPRKFQICERNLDNRRTLVPEAGISDSDCIPQNSVGCNYISLTEISASGTTILILWPQQTDLRIMRN